MHIYLNEILTDVPLGCIDVARLLKAKGITGLHIRVLVNDREIPVTALHDIPLTDGMRITVS